MADGAQGVSRGRLAGVCGHLAARRTDEARCSAVERTSAALAATDRPAEEHRYTLRLQEPDQALIRDRAQSSALLV